MSELTAAAQALDKLAVPYRQFIHTKPINSLEEAAAERGQAAGQLVRSILFRVSQGSFVMVLMAGPAQISWARLRAYLGQSRVSMASEAEVLEVTGYRVGAVSPFGLPQPIRILADESVFAPEEISVGSGQRGTAIILKSRDLRSTLNNIEIDNFAEKQP